MPDNFEEFLIRFRDDPTDPSLFADPSPYKPGGEIQINLGLKREPLLRGASGGKVRVVATDQSSGTRFTPNTNTAVTLSFWRRH